MIRFRMIMLVVLLAAQTGCEPDRPIDIGKADAQTLEIVIVNAEEHLGHNITEEGEHTLWIDGCTARIVATDEPFVIYWINNAIKDSSWSFEAGKTYRVKFRGELETAVMGYECKCIDLDQVERLEEI